MGKFVDLTGKRFGKLVVVEIHHKNKSKNNTRVYWLCKCDCGEETITRTDNLTSGTTKSCGCLHKEILQKNWHKEKHGLSYTRIHKIWDNMKRRCNNPNDTRYKNYGGRGIKVCEEWNNIKDGFLNFYDWAMENGYVENVKYGECTIDRIDVNGNYEPSNCRWVDIKTQSNNRSNNHYIKYNGETKTLMEWSECFGINYKTLYKRVSDGWNIEDALIKPIKKHYVKYKGESKTIREWCEILNLSYEAVKSRLNRGWSIEKALETPIRQKK